MKLNDAVTASITESNLFNEEGEGPRWRFNYNGKRVTDFNPDILLLGAYKHPSTGNNLVGGINLNYISPEQREKLAYALPQIMDAKNLRERYWTGRSLLPDVFSKYYRTYNPKYIRGVKKDVMYPKYGYLKSAQNWMKKKVGSIFKSKEQRAKELEPEYPEDLEAMSDKLDQVVSQLSQDPETDTPEIKAAMRAAQDFRRRKSLRDIEKQEDEPLNIARRDLETARREPGMQPPEEYENSEVGAGMFPKRPRRELVPKRMRRRPEQPPAKEPPRRLREPREPEEELPMGPPEDVLRPRERKRPIGRPEEPIERPEPRKRPPIPREPEPRRPIGRVRPEEPIDKPKMPKRPIGRAKPEDLPVEKPRRPIGRQKPPAVDNEIDPDIDLKEAIVYYSPVAGHYIIEHFDIG